MSESSGSVNQSQSIPETSYFLTQVGSRRFAFPADEVSEVMLVERSKVLRLPFYHPALVGVVHSHGQLVPLVGMQVLLDNAVGNATKEVFNAMQLNDRSPAAGVALIVDQLMGSCTSEQLQLDSTIEPFRPEILLPELWQPRRWATLGA